MPITREFAEGFFEALMSRDVVRIAPYVADDADWLIVGPIELFAYCGQHSGKFAVLEAYGRMTMGNVVQQYAREFLITDGVCASALSSLTAVQRTTKRQVGVRLAQFARFRDGKAYEFCSIIDTLGAAEQLVGHSLIPSVGVLADA